MARLLGEARVSILPDGTRFKPDTEAAVKKATEGINAKIPLVLNNKDLEAKAQAAAKAVSDSTKISIKASADTKELDAQMAELAARSEALKKSLGNLKVSDPNMQAFLKGITKQAEELRSSLDKIGDSGGIDKASSALDRMVSASDKVRAALGKTTFAEEEIAAAAQKTSTQVQNATSRETTAYQKAEAARTDAAQKAEDRIAKARQADFFAQSKQITDTRNMYSKLFDDLDKRDKIKLGVDGQYTDAQLASFRAKVDSASRKTNIRLGLDGKDAEAGAITLREKLNALLSDIRVKVHLDNGSVQGVLASIGGRFTKDIESAGGNAGGGFGNSFIGGLGKSALMQNPGITAAVIAGMAALPAAIGVVGVLGGIALGAGIMIGAEKMIKSQLKTLTTDIKNQTTLINAKGTSPAAAQAAQQALASDRAQVLVLNNQLAAFQRVNNAMKNLKNSFLNFAIVVSKPLIKPFADALNDLSNQLKGPLATGFTSLFKAVGPLVKPVEESLLEIVKGILPGLTDMLNKARGPLTALFLGFGKIVGVKIGDWFRTAAPYIQVSGKYFLALVSALGSTVTWLIKFGGETAKAFGGSQFKGFGSLIQQIANDLIKLVIPAFEGWTGVMAPVARDLLLILTPLLNFLAANPALVKGLAAMAAAWLLVSKAVTFSAIAMKLFGVSTDAILVAAPWIALAAAIILAAILIIKYWGPISSFFVKIWKTIWSGAIGPMINFFTNSVPHAFGVTVNWLKKNWPLLIGIIGGPFAEIAGIVIKYHNQIFNVVKSVWGHIENVIFGVLKPIASVTEGIWNVIYTVTKSFWNSIYKAIRIPVLIIVGLIGEAWIGIRNLTNMIWPSIYNTIKAAWGHIENVTTGIVKPMVNWVESAWGVLKNATAAAYNWLFSVIKAAWGHIENITTGIVKPMVNWVESAWNVLKSITSAAYAWIFNVIKAAWGHIENATTGIIKPMVNWINSSWNFLKNITRNAFNWIHDAIINPLQKAYNWIESSFVSGVKHAFSGLVSAVKSIWNGLKKVVGDPINFVIGIWNKFAGFVDKGLSIFGIKTKLPMGTPIKFAKGGKVPGFAPGVDSVHAMLSPGEFVLRPQAVAAIGVENLHRMNKMAKGYANGGDVVNDIEKWNGHKYVWGGGANPSTGWDCSSFVNYIVGHDFKLNLPGGGSWGQMTNNGAAHGPVASSYNNWNYGHGVPWSGAKKGDLAIENNGAHIGFIIQDNVNKSSAETLMGFAARSTATGTGYEDFFPSAFHLERFADDRGFGSQVFDNTIGAVLKAAASVALNGIEGLVNGAMNHIPGTGPIPQLAKVTVDDVINAAKAKLESNQSNFQFNSAAATGPAGSGSSAGEIANGKQIYEYLLANLFGGHKIAAAGATASIWGESTWNPFAQGSGGRGLIGWTPPSSISNADFSGGMKTQLPAILRFVVNSGDQGAIAQMFNASSVTQAANLWGHDVERFGVSDVHTTGIQLATSFMKNGGLIPAGVFDSGGTLMPGPNLAYNLTGAPERLNRQGGGNGNNTVTLEIVGGNSDVEQFIVQLIRKYARISHGGNVQKAFGKN